MALPVRLSLPTLALLVGVFCRANRIKAATVDLIQPDWTRVPQPDDELPPVTDISDRCSCDMRLGSCDANCCCDPECSQQHSDTFSTCLGSGSQPPGLDYCMAESTVAQVSPITQSMDIQSLPIYSRKKNFQNILFSRILVPHCLCAFNSGKFTCQRFPGGGSSFGWGVLWSSKWHFMHCSNKKSEFGSFFLG